ncbi:hypothetical protein [Leptospira andrefontaineae]|uniref:Membrane-binding protein n=1 Tax=Leptospira andrefontaineae TaxID=2484976 RepID=A0A4R9H4H8_9LEPT|nr:hypothetical protein [Leptospira andrefontaineae]TGK39826.1 hypothetical protein EHO65_11570 [Leptospira andrefontaineae]
MNKNLYPILFIPTVLFCAYYFFSPSCVSGDCKNGIGTKILSGSYRYDGSFQNGLAHGKGKLVLGGIESYDGDWNRGNKEGNGIYKYADGTIYEGEWKWNKRNGFGKLTDSEGNLIFEGQWKDDGQVLVNNSK